MQEIDRESYQVSNITKVLELLYDNKSENTVSSCATMPYYLQQNKYIFQGISTRLLPARQLPTTDFRFLYEIKFVFISTWIIRYV